MQLLMIIDASSMPTGGEDHYDESSGSGNDSYNSYENHSLPASEMSCLCNDTNLMVKRNFLLKWLNIAEHHSISKLSVAAHKLKILTEYLQVSIFVVVKFHNYTCNMYSMLLDV